MSPLRRAVPWLAIAALGTLVIFARLPEGPRFLYVLHKSGHPLVFGLIAWLIHGEIARTARPRGQALACYLPSLLLTLLLGGATELAQAALHRDASWLDVGRDGLGALTALAWHARQVRPAPARTLFATLLLLGAATPLLWCAAAYAHRALQFPRIAQLPSALDRYFVAPDGTGAGLYVDEPAPDWSGYSTLAVEVANPNHQPLALIVRIHDRRHNWADRDRYNGRFELAPDSRQILRVPLAAVAAAPSGRSMDLRAIAGVAVFVPRTAPPLPFVVSSLRLE